MSESQQNVNSYLYNKCIATLNHVSGGLCADSVYFAKPKQLGFGE